MCSYPFLSPGLQAILSAASVTSSIQLIYIIVYMPLSLSLVFQLLIPGHWPHVQMFNLARLELRYLKHFAIILPCIFHF